uniref:Uncharacterized protein n=1 Tax=Lepeophtheirus salmonis TaxID=72036 RepID=A0A0K2VKM8_LEPSM
MKKLDMILNNKFIQHVLPSQPPYSPSCP